MEPSPFTIRSTTDPALFDTLAGSMAASAPWKTLGMDAAACRAGFEGPCKRVFVAYYKGAPGTGTPAGLAIVQTGGSFNGYIQTLFVLAPFQGKGLGTQLLAWCEQEIHQTSPNVFICVSGFNTRALRLYESQGFTLVGTLKDFIVEGFDELLLRKSLGPRLGYTPPSGPPPDKAANDQPPSNKRP